MAYAFTRLAAKGRDYGAAYRALQDRGLAPADFWGVFHGLFGIASNELIVVSYGDVDQVHDNIAALDEVVAANTLLLEPTVRPTEYAPRTREGLYVFRFFEVEHKDVDEIAALSFERGRHSRTSTTTKPSHRGCSGSRTRAPRRVACCCAPGTTASTPGRHRAHRPRQPAATSANDIR